MSSPRNDPAIAETWLIPRAMPRWRAGNASVRIAVAFANSIAPPMPWPIRPTISHIAPEPPWKGSTESSTEKTENTAKPRLYIFTRP